MYRPFLIIQEIPEQKRVKDRVLEKLFGKERKQSRQDNIFTRQSTGKLMNLQKVILLLSN